ncbi:hypothetical protein AHF37_11090 [Paragonimus kellicotti]|nr:hypothetical protein AHF37_11090 [Paragonimus kellicotti]
MSAKRHNSKNKDVSSDDSLSDLEDSPPPKKKSNASNSRETSKQSSSANRTTNVDGDKMIDLTGKKFVCVRQFKGRVFVDIREYYEDKATSELKPGKKGVSLNVEQWDQLKEAMKELDRDIVNIHR